MSLFVLDTDILTLFQRGHARIKERVAVHPASAIAISVISVEEQLSGWYTQLRKAKTPEKLAWAYRRLAENVRFLSRVQIVDFEEPAIKRYQDLKRLYPRTSKLDLQIAATALHHDATLVSRNTRDFKDIVDLRLEDWSQ